ncbi:hypothetical protein [Halorubrum ezzemoulense]|jgi:hypothetical protein|uniref:hypothetical protein n=1 Tax=Halorubrum ezzemoulense TaxID=337243 RepID=UPI0023313266|nr:hypothetical protein [Halorubrum ezzemoulense]MDB2226033.1 hypothetical protein [Halorubrum ezzemoulense]MDB2239307.1 hypothetical protein [Halorubrum ezzemoulense]MDB2249784.1 hypothetical protein [Halorubrum ezzemoulense]MDB2253292.1 hypothetical protein [Halorubrum ezzemoulense]
MDVGRFEGVQSGIAERTELASGSGTTAVSFESVRSVESVESVVGVTGGYGSTLLAAVSAAVLLVVAVGALVVYRRQGTITFGGLSTSPTGGSASDGGGTSIDGNGGTSGETEPKVGESDRLDSDGANTEFDDRIGDRTLDRLEPVTPDAVSQVRDRLPLGRNAAPSAVDAIERDLRQAIEGALDEGLFDPTVTSPLGGTYDIVNLPSRFRELTVPPQGETVHVADLEGVVRDALSGRDLHEVARTVAAVHEHYQEIESHIRRREGSFLETRREAEHTLEDIRVMTDRFDGALADRVREFVVDGRHEALLGVRDIERRIDTADRSFHACAFNDANRAIRDAERAGDDLLMAVDFLGGVTGTIDHGSGRVKVPERVDDAFVADLVPILEQQYTVGIELDADEIVVSGGEPSQSGGRGSAPSGGGGGSRPAGGGSGSEPEASGPPSSGDSTGSSRERGGGREQLTPDAVADEILFVLRELDDRGGNGAVECQTELLPEAVARREVLEPLATFCRRQTDLVASVTLQENAPPGFFEIEFAEGTTASAGISSLRKRFTKRHGG